MVRGRFERACAGWVDQSLGSDGSITDLVYLETVERYISIMGMNIKNDEAQAMARELAALDHTTVTEAVRTALQEALDQRQARTSKKIQRAQDTLEQMRSQLAATPGQSLREANEALYDEGGLPQ